jgi:hypothetical protein
MCIGHMKCDITKPDVRPNLQKYLADGILVKQEQIPLVLIGRQHVDLNPRVISFTENSEINNQDVDVFDDIYDTLENYITARDGQLDRVPFRLKFFREVYLQNDLMPSNYVPNLGKLLLRKLNKDTYEIEDIQNSISDIPVDSFSINDSPLEFIKRVVKQTARFNTDANRLLLIVTF